MSLPGPPWAGRGDRAYAAAAVGATLVPVVGGAAVELVNSVFGPPLERRRQAWFEELADAVQTLQAHDVPVDSDEFVSAVAAASRIALGTHLDEKLRMLKAAVMHAALPDRPADLLTMRFLRVIEELDPEHFVMLAYLRDPAGHFERNGIPKPSMTMGGPSAIFNRAHLDMHHVDLVLRDLGDRSLADAGSWNTLMTADGAWAARSTALGNALLDFVSVVDFGDPA